MRAYLISCGAALFLSACGNSPVLVNQSNTPANQNRPAVANRESTRPPATDVPPRGASASPSGGGEPVDTSKQDAQISQLEERLRKKPDDAATRQALAKAYTERGDALTGVRQYRAALGDYRRALRNDPTNEQARRMSETIIGILQSMGRDVPPEGQEPTPLPLK